ncbi:hypothetical protein Pcinc_020484 [Petrolisthes cinctipes]|uniref:Mitochondrial thiamine pyrophosphate carrier n=1 Tax=Petrolisthes cinctipes TaxID=88211 RepID=A0AAE1FK55_PETCI|nr:hypothetical protein Pcinc_020484 [Petrolisthes cinctipes]
MVSHVGYRADAKEELSVTDHALAGAVSGMITRALAQPLDVLKIRFQLQVEPIARKGGGLYQGILQSVAMIIRMEGVSALWRGHVPAQFLSLTYGTAQFGSYALLTKAASQSGIGEGLISRGACGAVSGVCATLASFPFDVVRTRLIAQGKPKRYNGVVDGVTKMVREEGVLCVWRGIVPTLLMSVPYSGLTFYFYSIFDALSSRLMVYEREQHWMNTAAVSGTAAGVCAKVCVYPLDVLKKRLQIRGFEEARKQFGKVVAYPSAWKCLVCVTQEEGLSAWFKGLWPSLLKSGISTGIIFISYESTCRILAKAHNTKNAKADDR